MSKCSLWFSPIYQPFIYPNNDTIPVPSPASPLKCNDTCIKNLNNLVIKIPDDSFDNYSIIFDSAYIIKDKKNLKINYF